jgi:RNA polymerase sigma-70 factor, ECF subfamily
MTHPQRDLSDEALAERAWHVAHRTALGIVGSHDAAQDIAQEVAIEALRRRRAVRNPEQLDGWLYRVATRMSLRYVTRERRRRERETQRHAEARPHSTDTESDLENTLALLAGVPERQRAALTLRYVFDIPDAAIAAALDCSESTVRSLLLRGRATLRERLATQSTVR